VVIGAVELQFGGDGKKFEWHRGATFLTDPGLLGNAGLPTRGIAGTAPVGTGNQIDSATQPEADEGFVFLADREFGAEMNLFIVIIKMQGFIFQLLRV
jgi:hypothetical protein